MLLRKSTGIKFWLSTPPMPQQTRHWTASNSNNFSCLSCREEWRVILSSSFFVAGSPLEAVIACGSPWVKCLSVSSHTSRKGDVGEILMLGNLLDRLIGILQKIFDVFDHIIVYPLEAVFPLTFLQTVERYLGVTHSLPA